ncbi:MAG TPA: anti-sigma factor, partial [Burkholderiaceae bacterium]|nr:anti-sigma factor [Burkholderiaceae bacterium]
KRIEARLHGEVGAAGTAAGAPVGWWRQLAFWRGFSAIAGVVALGLALLLAIPGPVQPPVVVVLSAVGPTQGGATPASFVASISADGRALVTRPLIDVSVQADRALELWALPASGAPRSLGLISAHGTTVVTRDQVLRGATGLAVSLEPPGGSPTGAPTGPVLYVGKLTL